MNVIQVVINVLKLEMRMIINAFYVNLIIHLKMILRMIKIVIKIVNIIIILIQIINIIALQITLVLMNIIN